MSIFKTTAVIAVLALAGCSNGLDRFGDSGSGAGVDGGIGMGGFGSVDDPTSQAYFQQVVGDRVFFSVDESTLSADARAVLGEQARWMAANPDFAAVIEGHSDERGTTEYNIALGARRASAVQEFLFSQGVALSRLQTVSFGKERPLAICSDESCYNQNRRGVTVLRAGAGV